eukprot:TRINITY_DN2790_c0_g1_i2.p1 TRINITY_DN2790_c0_g1~~TRINITY_DN2790_c0_g1_i2.p1  ORF type:complete len:185 (-),score=25.57 TRINITY_DN2790_c0_g1_i2:149-703(-)
MNFSKEAYVNRQTNQGTLREYKSNEFSSLGNIFISEGKPGKVLKIVASRRKAEDNFVTAIRKALEGFYNKDRKQVGLGGCVQISNGKIKSHIMPSFPPKDSPGDGSWLRYFETPVPVTCLSVLVSADLYGDDLRLEHSHFWSNDGSTGGHYHNDVTPDTILYEAFYAPAQTLWRIDRAFPPHLY